MAWYTAPALKSLLAEINAAHPNRSKASDGFVGDTAHSARKSDHNPDYASGGVVRAGDFTAEDIDTAKLLAVAKADPRTNYIIFNRKIYGAPGFTARAYTGSNPHVKHVHISLKHTAAAEAAGAWGYGKAGAPKKKTSASNTKVGTNSGVLSKGSTGAQVKSLQQGMNRVFPSYANFSVDSRYGDYTVSVVKEFQRRSGLTPDGVVGPITRAALIKAGVKF